MSEVSFSVRVGYDDKSRWRRVASFRGFHSVGAWLASLGNEDASRHADAAAVWFAEEAARQPSPLAWRRGRFGVNLREKDRYVEVEQEGLVSPPFGIYRYFRQSFSLAHLPTGHTLATTTLRRDCQLLAAKLARCDVNWHETNDEKVLAGPGCEEAMRILRTVAERERKDSAAPRTGSHGEL